MVATISSTLRLEDAMSKPLQDINKNMKSVESTMQGMDGATAKAGTGFTSMGGVAVTAAMAAANAISSLASTITNKLNAALDSALDRIDTMERFNRTMTVLGGSADVATAAVSRTRDIVLGTAYGLDTAASAVQNFVTSGMSVGDATDQVEALANATSFYGQGTNEALSTVSEAWGKIAGSVSVSAADIRSLTLAGIPVYSIYADAVGSTAAAVKEDLSAGTITAKEFQSTLTEALMEGTENFPALAGAAREAGASWSGTFDNMKAAATRGMQGIVNSIDSALEDSGLPNMRDMISNFGSTIETVLGKAAIIIGNLVQAFAPLGIAIKEALEGSAIALFIEKLGGMEAIGKTVMAGLVLSFYQMSATFMTVVYGILDGVDYLKLGFTALSTAIPASLLIMKSTALSIAETMVNGIINIINNLIGVLNNIPGVEISAIEQVSFAAGAQAEAAAASSEALDAISAAYDTVEGNIADRASKIADVREKGFEQYQSIMAGGGAAAATPAVDLYATGAGGVSDDLLTNSSQGKALKTKVTDEVKIDGENLKMALDISTRQFAMTYQKLTPEISVNIDTVNENANVNQVIDVLADWTAEVAGSALNYGTA